MPATSWDEIAGKTCVACQKPATHYWGVTPYCCHCHLGDLATEENPLCGREETLKEHQKRGYFLDGQNSH